MTTKAQIKASNKYNKLNSKQICIRFNKRYDADLITFLESKPSMAGYIRDLVKKDMINTEYTKSKIIY